jgi:hypothetical protein
MAEKALYNNSQEPDFPSEKLVDNLAWLGPYLTAREKGKSAFEVELFESLLDTVLVWSRARTAGLHAILIIPNANPSRVCSIPLSNKQGLRRVTIDWN